MQLRAVNNKHEYSQGFLLTNKKGSFAMFLNNSKSKYSGVFLNDNSSFDDFQIFKIIEDIRLDQDIRWVETDFCCAKRKRGSLTESFFMPPGFDSLVYEINKKAPVDIILDVKKAYDNRIWGRNYDILREEDYLLVRFSKKSDEKEDPASGDHEYSMFIVVMPEHMDGVRINGLWEEYHYNFDESRNSYPYSRHVYNAATINSSRIVFTFGKDADKAVKDAFYIRKNLAKIRKKAEKHNSKTRLNKLILNEDVRKAYESSIYAVKSLVSTISDNKKHFTGIYAGLPWFFHFWSRDELIALNSFQMFGEKRLVMEKLLYYLKLITPDGKIPNRIPKSDLDSMDSLGWLFKRCSDMLSKGYFSRRERLQLSESVTHAVFLLRKFHVQHGLLYNSSKETWMDTVFRDGGREGFRIEMQALLLNIYKLAFELTKDDEYFHLMEQTKEEVRKKFWDGYCLKDGSDDETVRPNIFMAYYIFPELLEIHEWKKCFQYALPKLWCSWGGLSTIDKRNPLYCSEYTGENNQSYHRGDSWYFLNNMAAVAMHRVDQDYFYEYIMRILEASTSEIIHHGVLGYHAELSSSSCLRSEGCLAQLWSSALYIELIEELFD